MKRFSTVVWPLQLILSWFVVSSAFSQETLVSPVSGFLKTVCSGGSDTRVSVPFHQVPAWAGIVVGPPASPGVGLVRLSFGFPPQIPAGSFAANLHFLLFREPGSLNGRSFPISAHGAGTVDIQATPAEVFVLGYGDRVEVVRAWTLDSLFPSGLQETFHVSEGLLATGRGSELLLFNDTASGVQLAPSRRFFINENGWVEIGSYAAAGSVPIPPGASFLIRHPQGSLDTVFTALQQVYGGAVALPLRISDGERQDTVSAPPRPVMLALDELDITSGFFEESASSDPADRRDELLVFDNDVPGINKTPSATYFRTGGVWKEETAGYPSAGSVVLEPSAGFVVRKAAGLSDATDYWVNSPRYDVEAP